MTLPIKGVWHANSWFLDQGGKGKSSNSNCGEHEHFRKSNPQDKEQDKYSFDKEVQIDCENMVHICKAACCRMSFALSRQDIEEGKLRWNFEKPYLSAKDGSGYCYHLDKCSYLCTIREQRPVPCRAYDCRKDKRIWIDFEKGIINPEAFKIAEEGRMKWENLWQRRRIR